LIYKDEKVPEEERKEELRGIQIRSMARKDKEDQIRGKLGGRMIRVKLKVLKEKIIRINMCIS